MTASPYDRGYAEGLRAAAKIARRAAEAVAATGERRVVGGAVAALTGLAEEIEAALAPAAPAQAERAP